MILYKYIYIPISIFYLLNALNNILPKLEGRLNNVLL